MSFDWRQTTQNCPGCCDAPVPSIVLETSSTQLSTSGCGQKGYTFDGTESSNWYGTVTTVYTAKCVTSHGPEGAGDSGGCPADINENCTETITVKRELQVVDGAVVCHQDPLTDTGDAGCDNGLSCDDCSAVGITDEDSSQDAATSETGWYKESIYKCHDASWLQCALTMDHESSTTITLSDPIDHMAFLSANLPAYSDWGSGGDADSAYANDAAAGSFLLRKSKARLKHGPSPTCYLKVWLRLKFTADADGSVSYTNLPAYTWTATGSPCANPADVITGSEMDIAVPTSDGTNTLEIVAYSFLQNYDPTATTPVGPSGFPTSIS